MTLLQGNTSSSSHQHVARSTSSSSSSPFSSDTSRRKSTLIDLNNSALSMLQTGCCKNTIATFKDALGLLKSGVQDAQFDQAVSRTQERVAHVLAHADSIPPSEAVVMSMHHNAKNAYEMLSTLRTSKVCLTMEITNASSLSWGAIRSILVYNYGIAHRCCPATENTRTSQHMQSFCLQIFQYAETLLPPEFDNNLFKLVLTRNLMMLSCRLGMSLCEHYKTTLDPVVAAIMGLPEDDETESQQGTPAA